MTPEFGAGLDAVSAAIGECTGASFKPCSVTPVSGGSIHRAWHIHDRLRHYFVKTGALGAAPMFAAEAHGLEALASAGAVRTPAFVTLCQSGAEVFLVLEHLELETLDAQAGAKLGTSLARLHRVTGDSFGWAEDNFIGATPQHNARHAGWPHFFGQRRLRPQLRLALQNGMAKTLVAQGDAVIDRIGGLFIDYRPVPGQSHE